MHIVRVQTDRPRYGFLAADGEVVHLLDGDPYDLPATPRSSSTVALADCELLTPVTPTKILAIGRNYAAHAEEMGLELGGSPSVFMKPLQTLVPHGGTVVLPPVSVSTHVEHEAEVAVVIGRTARGVKAADWADYVLGFTCANDVSARDLQKADPQITRGKGFDTFCPLGPFVDTDFARDEATEVSCTVNGIERQRATTAQLIFSIPTLIEWLSSWTTLVPGDVILTGSPAGTTRLAPGDSVEISVSGVGTLQHLVAADQERSKEPHRIRRMTDTGTAIADLLSAGGVQRLYMVPGESFLEVIDGVERHPDIRLVSARHESGAAFMGEADAKMTGRPAVVAGTRAVGAANLAIGVHTAFQDSTPMVVLLGQVETEYLGREGFQEIDLPSFYAPITKWAVTAHRTDRIPELIAKALRIAQSGRPGPTMIAFPADVLRNDIDPVDVETGRRRLEAQTSQPEPDQAAVDYVARRLAEASRPVVIAGGGARAARDDLVQLAEHYSVGVYASFRRQDVFPNSHPLYLGHLSLGVGGERLDALRDADLVVVIGCRLSEITTFGYSLPAADSEVIQVDTDVSVLGSVAALSMGIVSDAGRLIRAVVAQADRHPEARRDWSSAHAAFLAAAEVPPSRSATGIDSAQVVRAMREVFPEDTVITNDAGNFSAFLHQHWLYEAASSQVAPTSGAMGYGTPSAIGAKIAAPHRTVVGVAGDGGFTMSGMEIETAVREQVDITVVVMRNGLQGTIAMHQARASGRLSGVAIGDIDVSMLARSLGASGLRVDREDDLSPAFREALATTGPVVVDVVTDPEVLSPGTRLSKLLAPPAETSGP